MTVHELFRQLLPQMQGESAYFDLTQLFIQVFGCPPAMLEEAAAPLPGQEEQLRSWVAQLQAGQPLQYLLGEWDFFGLTFRVGPGVLIPRADTEVLVEQALARLPEDRPLCLADLCSGSGAVAIALASQRPQAVVYAVEWSPEAFGYLQENIARHQLQGRVFPIRGDVRSPGSLGLPALDLLAANPPYVRRGELGCLPPQVRCEPAAALDGGEDGLDFYRVICGGYRPFLKEGAPLLVEVGCDQHGQVLALMEQAGFCRCGWAADYGRQPRVVWGYNGAEALG